LPRIFELDSESTIVERIYIHMTVIKLICPYELDYRHCLLECPLRLLFPRSGCLF
jgi:hypothetical protein